mmetsp:Transcript_5161/g.6733  ORF Transcript_5161/g.6733 Transcript_5161/m.6733 type:complete len:200 (+) Transcript_5161:163-762(+)|eukprot:CAMPEP_0198139830 /NCGR_PEP_ID=MMETSP1443-20131203/3063_1 /TAXON_ID=186043 /ORGANISM="Entomoneis sp., Strain CCMP2396" /LENGTH=199 /DNA_ID=CAMNT_0043802073 /DNA_START=146 /DNA_END=745 /DNA_ORIENTATION=-
MSLFLTGLVRRTLPTTSGTGTATAIAATRRWMQTATSGAALLSSRLSAAATTTTIKSGLVTTERSLIAPSTSRLPLNILGQSIRSFASKKHKAVIRQSKGFRGRSKNCFKIAVRRLHKSWQYAYRDRRRKKREWRKLWIQKIGAAVRQYNWNYSTFINGLNKSNIQLNRKSLANLGAYEPFTMKAIVDIVNATAPRAVA